MQFAHNNVDVNRLAPITDVFPAHLPRKGPYEKSDIVHQL